jgi:hypothetical protein
MITILLLIFLSPFIFWTLKLIIGMVKPPINNTLKAVFPEKEGAFDLSEFNFLELIRSQMVFSLTYFVNQGYIAARKIDKDCNTYKSIYLIVDYEVLKRLKLEFPELMVKNEINTEKTTKLIPFLYEYCRFYRYKTKQSDTDFNYHIGINLIQFQMINNSNWTKVMDEITGILNTNSEIRWNYKFIQPSYRYEYVKMLRENWSPQTELIPEKWFYVKYSEQWNQVRDEQIFDRIKK